MKDAGQNSGIEQTVLIVDDEKVNRILLGKAFAGHYAVREATDGEQALAQLRAHEDIVAVVLDINMPGMNGFDVLERMQRSKRMREIPVIVITANEDTQTQLRALSTGAIDVVFKPFNPLIVRQRVSNQISRMNALRLAQKAAETERSLKKAETDAVSGLYNKGGFLRRAATLVNQEPNGQYVLVRWDIDNFKVFNDTFGLKCGDEYLHRVGQRYLKQQNAGNGPRLICRYEADHFVYLTPAENFDPHEELQKLKKLARLPQKTPFQVTIRMGLYPVTDTRVEVSLMCDRALMALKSTKDSFKKNFAWFEESMRDDMLAEQRIVGNMEKALQNREFQIYLQPQYNHETREMMGAEALARWIKPDGTMMPPSQFIPIFEKNGFIFELDYYIWEQTCILLRRWLDRDMARIPLSVNVSRYDIMQPSFTKRLLGLVKKYKLPVDLLRLEITESAFARNTAYLIKVVEELRGAGFLIEIDDFGSGYSSFNTLKDVPANILKLDMRFLQGETHMRRGGTILESVVRMAHWLHMMVIAEGVETAQQADFLKSIGCVCIQGYYYSRPVPVDVFEHMIAQSGQSTNMPAIRTTKGMSAAAFWNPASIDSLIFSSYVGPACVMESQNGRLQIIRANDSFRESLRTTLTIGQILDRDIFANTTQESAQQLRDAMETAQELGDSFTGIFSVMIGRDGPKHTEYLRYVGHIIAKSSRYSIAYLLVENITEQHLTEERAQEMTGQLAMLNDISRDLLYQTNVENALHSALSKMLTYFAGERIYVFEFDEARGTTDNTYEICAPGVVPEQALLQGVAIDTVAYWINAFQRQPHLYVNVDELGADREKEKLLLVKQGIHALVAVPIREDGKLTGFLGVDNPSQNIKHVTPLTTLGNYIATLLSRRGLLKRLQEQNEELSSVLRSIPGGIFKYSAQTGQFEYISDRLIELLGYTKAEFTEKFHNSFFEMIWTEDREKTLSRIQEDISKTGEYDTCIYRVETRSGKLKWLYDVGHLLTDDQGGQWYEVLVLDHDEQENLRTQLRATQKKTEAILRRTPGGIICYRYNNKELHMEYASDGVWRMLGYEPGELKTDDHPIAHPEDIAALRASEMNMIQTGEPMQMEYRLQKKDGSYLWVHIAGIYEPDGSDSGMLYGSYTDITELVAVQQKLAETNEQMDTILNALPGGVAVFKIDGNQIIRTFISRGASRVLGYSPDDPIPSDMSQTFEYLHPDDFQKLSTLISAGMSGSQIRNVELRVLPKNKPMRWIRLDANPVRNDSGELYYYGIYSDITENVRIRQDQERKQERLLSRYRHELNYVENTGDDGLVAKVRLNLNTSEIEESWVRQDFTQSYTGDAARTALDKVLATCVRNEQRDQLEKMMRISNLLAEYQADNKDFQVDYQRYAASGRTVWVSTVVHTRMDPVAGQIKAFIYTYDVDEQKAPAMLVERMLATQADFLGLIDVKTGRLHCYHYAGEDPWVAEKADIPYEREVRLFAEKHIGPKLQNRMTQALSLKTVLENISTLDTSYTRSCWIDCATDRRRMSWRFLWMDESRTTVILSREDITATYDEQRTQRKMLHQALTRAKQATVDGLTGLLTRAATEQAIAEKLEEADGEPLALMLMDLDNLKQINDNYGHMEGDEALRSMAAVLKKSFRGSDVIGRVGGDEFMVLLTQVPPQDGLCRMVQRFMNYMREQKIGPNRTQQLSCSVGVTVGRAETHPFQRLYHEADVALYHVKQRGKADYAFFDATMAEGHYAGLD